MKQRGFTLLVALNAQPDGETQWRGPYLKKVPLAPLGTTFVYKIPSGVPERDSTCLLWQGWPSQW